MTDLAIVTCLELPEPDWDEPILMEALAKAGIDAAIWAWDDPAVDWSSVRVAVMRSTWDYPLRYGEFVSWAERTSRQTRLLNPFWVVEWNAHKKYLVELADRGVPVAATDLVVAGSPRTLDSIMDSHRWDDVVVKPAISAGSLDTLRVTSANLEAGREHFRWLVRDRDALVQPYLVSVDDYGERACVWIDGEFTHSVRKTPRFLDDEEAVSEALEISEDEEAVASVALAGLEDDLLYARVDLAPGPDGTPVVMEVELIEPSLFLKQSPEALARLIQALGRLV